MAPVFHVDAFTDKPFAGNPAAVCLLDQPAEAEWMQNVAREMNLSETAFVHPTDDGYGLRWFTPTVEVDLCGHATLAAAHVLWEEASNRQQAVGNREDKDIGFYTKSGILKAVRGAGMIEMDFPALPVSEVGRPLELEEILGIEIAQLGGSKFDLIAEVISETVLRSIRPDFTRLARLDVRGLIVTSHSDEEKYDFVSRYFAPAAGVNEDPVTGSAHCCLGVYWQNRLGKNQFIAYQASERGGIVHVRIEGDRAILGGNAVTVAQGQLAV